jgi:hypothetical protein
VQGSGSIEKAFLPLAGEFDGGGGDDSGHDGLQIVLNDYRAQTMKNKPAEIYGVINESTDYLLMQYH